MNIEFKITWDDLPQELKDCVELDIYTEEEALKEYKKYLVDKAHLRGCKYCHDLNWLYKIVCYVPTKNGGSVSIPVNCCPACGRKLYE